jgi:hypothetical protein
MLKNHALAAVATLACLTATAGSARAMPQVTWSNFFDTAGDESAWLVTGSAGIDIFTNNYRSYPANGYVRPGLNDPNTTWEALTTQTPTIYSNEGSCRISAWIRSSTTLVNGRGWFAVWSGGYQVANAQITPGRDYTQYCVTFWTQQVFRGGSGPLTVDAGIWSSPGIDQWIQMDNFKMECDNANQLTCPDTYNE